MRPWASLLILLFTASLAAAQSLGEVAQREREHREKEKEKQGGTKTKVIDELGLTAGPGKDAKGTFNPAAGSPRSAGTPSPSTPGASTTSGGRLTDVDLQRAAARRRLAATYMKIYSVMGSFLQAVQQYERRCGDAGVATNVCASQFRKLASMTVGIATAMSLAEEEARQGWVPPGEVRQLRMGLGLDDSNWDELARAVERYRP